MFVNSSERTERMHCLILAFVDISMFSHDVASFVRKLHSSALN